MRTLRRINVKWAAAAWLAFIILVSLYPLRLNLDPHRVQTRWDSLRHSLGGPPHASWNGVGDVTVNLLLYIPLGLLVAPMLRTRFSLFLIGAAGPLLSIAIEYAQVYFSRYPNVWDVAMNSLGWFIGFAMGIWFSRRLIRFENSSL